MKIEEITRNHSNSYNKFGMSEKNKVCTLYAKIDGDLKKWYIVKDNFFFRYYKIEYPIKIHERWKFLETFHEICNTMPDIDALTALELTLL